MLSYPRSPEKSGTGREQFAPPGQKEKLHCCKKKQTREARFLKRPWGELVGSLPREAILTAENLSKGVRPAATGRVWPRMAMNAAQHKIVGLLKTFFFIHQFSLVFVCLTCDPRQLFSFQCGPETPKGWTPLQANMYSKNLLNLCQKQ